MAKKIDRIGETGRNNFGSEMIIAEYRKYLDIDVYFPEYDWTYKNAKYQKFKNGNIKCPYERRYFGIGYLGEGKYKVTEHGKLTRVYSTWYSMIERCYDEKYHEIRPTYINCEVDKDWLNFQKYGKWFSDNYYEIDNETMCLDKDILCKGNKIYSPDTCVFVPQTINKLFVKSNKSRGDSVIGTSLYHGKYEVKCWLFNPETGKSKQEHLGRYETQEKAFEVYKYCKEKNIKQIADYYKEQITINVYNALYRYEIEITDYKIINNIYKNIDNEHYICYSYYRGDNMKISNKNNIYKKGEKEYVVFKTFKNSVNLSKGEYLTYLSAWELGKLFDEE